MNHPQPARRQLLERGATSTEYALLITLIAAMIIAAVAAFGITIGNLFGIPPGYL